MSTEIDRNSKEFAAAWIGGYYEGDPTSTLCVSSYGQFGFMSNLHATYLRCIKPYIRASTCALEIGPGRGAWTQCLLASQHVWVMDVLSESQTKLKQNLGDPGNLTYLHVQDFGCRGLPDDYFDYLFSFGCLCHVSFQGISAYAENLWPKLRSGAECFWMIADFEQYNAVVRDSQQLSIVNLLAPNAREHARLPSEMRRLNQQHLVPLPQNDGSSPAPMTWYNAGRDRTCEMLDQLGYQIMDGDVGTCIRDPIIHFRKP